MSGTLVAHGSDIAAPTFTADHKWTHLEARYNYEATHTASLWFGYFTYKKLSYSTTFFNFGWTDPTINLSLTYSF